MKSEFNKLFSLIYLLLNKNFLFLYCLFLVFLLQNYFNFLIFNKLKANIEEMEHFRKNIIHELAGNKPKDMGFHKNIKY